MEVTYALCLTQQNICKRNVDDKINEFLHPLSVKYNSSCRPGLTCQEIAGFMSICFLKNASWLTWVKNCFTEVIKQIFTIWLNVATVFYYGYERNLSSKSIAVALSSLPANQEGK